MLRIKVPVPEGPFSIHLIQVLASDQRCLRLLPLQGSSTATPAIVRIPILLQHQQTFPSSLFLRTLLLLDRVDIQVAHASACRIRIEVPHMVLQHPDRSRRHRYRPLDLLLTKGEIIGYIGRVGSAYDVTLNNYFIMQICCLIISPAFFSAALYLTIGNL